MRVEVNDELLDPAPPCLGAAHEHHLEEDKTDEGALGGFLEGVARVAGPLTLVHFSALNLSCLFLFEWDELGGVSGTKRLRLR